MPPLKGDEEEVKVGKGLKLLSPNKLLIRLPILLAQLKPRYNLAKLKRRNQTNIISFVSASQKMFTTI